MTSQGDRPGFTTGRRDDGGTCFKGSTVGLFRNECKPETVQTLGEQGLGREIDRFNLVEHLAVYFLASLAVALLLYEQSQLSSRAGVQVDVFGLALVQKAVMALLLFGVLIPVYAWYPKRWAYALAAILFAGYSGTRMTAAFTATLGLVPTLTARGIPISDYQGTFYLLALTSAFSYLLMILLLRRSYGKLRSKRAIGIVSEQGP